MAAGVQDNAQEEEGEQLREQLGSLGDAACGPEGAGRFFTYVLTCSDGSLYTGFTTDVEHRVAQHNAGAGAKYTKARRPVKLRAVAEFSSRHQALSAEFRFKQLSRQEKLHLLSQVGDGVTFADVLVNVFPLN